MKTALFNKVKRSGLVTSFEKMAGSLMLILISVQVAQAQTEEGGSDVPFANLNETELLLIAGLGLLIALTLLVVVVCLYALFVIKQVQSAEKEVAKEEKEKESISLWTKLNRRFVSGELVPVSDEKEIMLDHTYDGISELDNHMPPWLKYMFYVTILFAIVYVMHYLVLGTGALQLEEYETELAEAEALSEEQKLLAKSSIDENNAVLISDAAELGEAEQLYIQNCAPCHAKDGGGTVGPNLTDEYWIHGGSIRDIFSVIKYGVQEKGMIPWEGKLSPEEIQGVASYIISLQGTTPAAPKEPQGEKYERESNESAELSSLE